jgi:hypothetical protein
MACAKQMLDTYPRSFNLDAQPLAACIEACVACAQACTACADACLSENNVAELAKCIRLDLDCADVCAATGKVLSRQTDYDANLTRVLLQACAQACRAAERSASATPGCMRTVECAPRRAGVAVGHDWKAVVLVDVHPGSDPALVRPPRGPYPTLRLTRLGASAAAGATRRLALDGRTPGRWGGLAAPEPWGGGGV